MEEFFAAQRKTLEHQGAIACLAGRIPIPLKYLWKKVEKMATHLNAPDFSLLQAEVDKALLHFAQMPHKDGELMTRYCKKISALRT